MRNKFCMLPANKVVNVGKQDIINSEHYATRFNEYYLTKFNEPIEDFPLDLINF